MGSARLQFGAGGNHRQHCGAVRRPFDGREGSIKLIQFSWQGFFALLLCIDIALKLPLCAECAARQKGILTYPPTCRPPSADSLNQTRIDLQSPKDLISQGTALINTAQPYDKSGLD